MPLKTYIAGVIRASAVLCGLWLFSCASAAIDAQAPLAGEGAGLAGDRSDSLPFGVSLHAGTRGAYYLEMPVARARTVIKPAVREQATLMAEWASDADVAAVINGGFFIAHQPVSLVVRDGEVLAENIAAVTRGGAELPVRRSAFWIDSSGKAVIDWVARDANGELKAFAEPLPYRAGQPGLYAYAPAEPGRPLQPFWAIGGGPRLLRNGELAISYDEEVFWGSGVTLEEARPRSAICVTSQQNVLLYITPSARLHELASELRALDCRDAMNLDGGGSSAMYVGGEKILDQERPVPAVLTVVREARMPTTP